MLLEWHKVEEYPLISYQKPHSNQQQWFDYLPTSFRLKKKALILDLEGVLLATFELHPGFSRPSWTRYMRIVKDNNEMHAVRGDAEYFLSFCFEFFEVWIWSCHRLKKAQCIISTCFPAQSHKFKMIMDNRYCQNSNFMIGYKRAYHKNLPKIWQLFDYLDEGNTIMFDDTPYRVMWNMRGTYMIFPKFWNQAIDLLGTFLKDVIIPWLCGWLYAKDKREYTINNYVKFYSDPETKYVMECYMSQRIENLKREGLNVN